MTTTTTANEFQELVNRIDDTIENHINACKVQYGLFSRDTDELFQEIKSSGLSEAVKQHLGTYFAQRSEAMEKEFETWMEQQ